MKKLRKSKYAFFVKKENGNYIVYSSMSGAVICRTGIGHELRLRMCAAQCGMSHC